MNLTPERISLLRKVQEKIRTEPTTYDQENFGRIDECGTACCIAGWACVLSGKYAIRSDGIPSVASFYDTVTGKHADAHDEAAKLLGLSVPEADILFTGDAGEWPEPFGHEWEEADRRVRFTDTQAQSEFASIAVRYIDYIIENGRVD